MSENVQASTAETYKCTLFRGVEYDCYNLCYWICAVNKAVDKNN